ncbi:hypothetical protein [Cyanobium sp. ATX-6F1]|uniref:hypothetical protein n=1 Tax=Cyanobium sp. ATX-6F1 TaxID=3137388 RepID=UPI0039BE06CE
MPPAGFAAPAPPPPADPAQVLQQAERYFAYAELLAHQGSGDLAGAVYRQAYVGLRALFGAAAPSGVFAQPVLPPARSAQAPNAVAPVPFRGAPRAGVHGPAAEAPQGTAEHSHGRRGRTAAFGDAGSGPAP